MRELVRLGAQELQKAIVKLDGPAPRRYVAPDAVLPFYEAYLLMHWGGHPESFKTSIQPSDVKRVASFAGVVIEESTNAWLRRKQLGSLLHLAQSLRMRKMPLFGSNVTVSLADSSIRDFLEIMAEILDRYLVGIDTEGDGKSGLERFVSVRTQIAQSYQNDGIYASSQDYYNGVANHAESDADAMSRLINGLGTLTSLLQSNPADPRVFASPERGVYLIDYDMSDTIAEEEAQFAQSIIQHAMLAGYIRSEKVPRSLRGQADPGSKQVAFRLHRRFAPYFHFSYRGAYLPVRITQTDIANLCRRIEEQSPFAWAKTLAGVVGKVSDRQIRLPLTAEDQNG